jgi:Flp pilus assembly protein TadD
MQLGRRPAAEAAFRKALEHDGDAADALNNLAWLLFEEKRFEEAEPLARKAASVVAPDPWMRLDTLGRILQARGACAEASAVFRKALEEIPETRREERAAIEQASRASCVEGITTPR